MDDLFLVPCPKKYPPITIKTETVVKKVAKINSALIIKIASNPFSSCD
jgi:hypothetical protein